MHLTDHLRRLLAYEGWANGRTFAAAEAAYATDERTARLLSHIVHAHIIWLERIAGVAGPVDTWQVLPWEELLAREAQARATWLHYLDADDLERPIAYSNLQGTPWTTPLGDILQHVLNHSTYHRGQVAAHLAVLNVPTVSTDYVVYCRTGGA
jgi:uncharacterized damage-inducible protein DinB